jgi:peroxiredoxin
MLVEDGLVKALNVDATPGKVEDTGAEHLLEQM